MDINRKELSRIKEVLKDNPRGMTVTEIAKAIVMNRHSVAKYMDMLVVSGHVDMRAFGPSKVYYLSTRLPISAMLSLSSDLIIILDKSLSIVNVNERFVEFTGIKRNDILNKSMEYFSFPIEFKPSIIPSIKNALNGEESRVDAYYQQKNKEFDFIVKFIPTVFDDGEKGVTVIFEDITERKRIENAIRESEQKFRNVIEQSSDGLILADERGIVIEYNKSCENISGLNGKDMVGRPIWEMPFMFKPEEGPSNKSSRETTAMLRSFLKTGESPMANRIKEYDLKHPDGGIRKVQVNAFPIKTEKGYMICGIARDITDLKMAETSLAESEEKFRTLAETFADGIIIFQEQKLVYNNRAASTITGYPVEDLVTIDLKDIISREQWEIFNVSRTKRLSFEEIIDSRKNTQFGMKIYTSKKEVRWLDIVVWSSNFKGKPATIVVFKDVTERKYAEEALIKAHDELEERVTERTMQLQEANLALRGEIEQRIRSENALRESEEKYRNLVENISDVAWEIDIEGRFTYISPKIKDMMGYDIADFIGKTIVEFLAPSHMDGIVEGLTDLFGKPQSYTLQETHMICKDGREIIVEASGLVLLDEQNNFKGYRGVTRDITARKLAQDAQRRAEEKYRNIVENINDWVWETDNTGRFTYSSPKIYDILGYRSEEIVGKRPFDMMLPENGKKMYYRTMEMARRGESFSALEGEHVHKNGHTVYLEVSGKPFYDKNGTVIGYTGIAHDITERKMSEQKLLQTTMELKAIFSAFPDIIFRTDNNGVIIDYNTARPDNIFTKHDSIPGKSICDVLPGDSCRIVKDAIKQVSSTGKMAILEYQLYHDNKKEIFEVRLMPMTDEQVIVIMRPITEKKRIEEALYESENKFRMMVENINDIAWEMDKRSRFTYVSPKVLEILGHPPEHYVGKVITEFVPPEDLKEFAGGFGRIFANPRAYGLENLRMYHKDGRILSMEVNGTPFYDEKGEFCGFRGVTRDITRRKQMEEMLELMKNSIDNSVSHGR